MRNIISGPTAQCQGLTAKNGAIARALSFYPNFGRMPEAERGNVRNDLVLMVARLQKVQSLAPPLGRIEFSPQMTALLNFAGLA
jgi:hypothetical protein